MKNTVKFILFPIALACANLAHAQSAGTLMVRVGVTTIKPNVESGELTAPSLVGTKASIDSASQVSGGITYMYTNNVSIDVPLALPFTHDILGDGAILGVGKIADVKALPATLLVQWRFMEPRDAFRPYVGVGLTYAAFFGARGTSTLTAITGGTPSKPTTLSIGSKFAPTVQVGASVALNQNWYVDANYTYTPLTVTNTLSTGQTLESKINPGSLSLAVGYMF
ncbi:MAG: OmpW family protein [Candidatus Saccharibacteria bacterium]|nr:OmpW family protein [Rhodoferax sp.]